MSTAEITATETGRNLVIEAPYGTYVIEPLPAKEGGKVMQQFVGVSFGTLDLNADEQESMFEKSLGPTVYNEVQNTLRLAEVQPIALIALYWQTIGIEGVNAFLEGGAGKALEVLLSQTGLLQQMTSNSLAAAVTTPSPADTNDTSTRSGGETK